MKSKKHKNKNAFTLTELIAVIVILSIIALIATPVIIGIINNLRDEAFRISVRNIFSAVEIKKYETSVSNSGKVKDLNMKNNGFDGGVWTYDETIDEVVLTAVEKDGKFVCELSEQKKNTNFEISQNCYGIEEVVDNNPGELEGSGTELDPYVINSVEDLVFFSKSVDEGTTYKDQFVKLGYGLDFDWNFSYVNPQTTVFGDVNKDGKIESLKIELLTGNGFDPIGERIDGTFTNDKHFAGTFLGDNKKIKGLYIKNLTIGVNGLFSIINGATILDLSIIDADITSYSFTGIAVGRAYYDASSTPSTIINVHVQGKILTRAGTTGGLIGRGYGNITDCSADVDIELSESGSSLGGLIGDIYDGNIINNYTTGTLTKSITTDTYSQTGGLIGIVRTTTNTISNNSADVTIISNSGRFVGGLIGYTYADVKQSSSASNITASNGYSYGGLIGYGNGAIDSSYATGNITSTSTDITANIDIGGIVGYAAFNVTDSYATGNVTSSSGYNIGGLIGRGVASITNSYATGNVTNLGEGQTYAQMGGLVGYITNAESIIGNCYATGPVTSQSGISIGGIVGYHYGVIENSYATGNVTSNMTTRTTNITIGGLAGHIKTDVIDSYATGDVIALSGYKIGGLLGSSDGSIINSYAIGDVSLTGGAQENAYVGGLVGYAASETGVISNSYATGAVTSYNGTYVGGLAASAYTIVENSYATGNVKSNMVDNTGSLSVGGLIGRSNNMVIDSYANGNVQVLSGYNIGGLVGYATNNILNSYATGSVQMEAQNQKNCQAGGLAGYVTSTATLIQNTHATGNVYCYSGKHVGGLVGVSLANIKDSYSSGTVTQERGYSYGGEVEFVSEGDGIISTTSDYVGGLVSYIMGSIENSHSTGNVNGSSAVVVGGLAGIGCGNVINSYTTGIVTGRIIVGGLYGFSSTCEPSSVINSYATGNVSSLEAAAGGLIGFNSGFNIKNSYARGNVVSLGQSSNSVNDCVGGLIGCYQGSFIEDNIETIENVYYIGNVTGVTNVGGLTGRIGTAFSDTHFNKLYVVANVTSTNGEAGGITEYITSLAGYTDGTINLQNMLINGSVSGNVKYPMVDRIAASFLTTDNLFRSSTLQITGPTNSHGTTVNVNDLKTSTWYMNTLGFDDNWSFTSNYYPKLYKVDVNGNPKTELLGGQNNVLVE